MGHAFIGYSFGFVAPDARVGIYLHGFPPASYAGIDVRARRSAARPGAFQCAVEVEEVSVAEHIDGTLAHRIHVHNISTSTGAPPIPVVDIAVFLEELQ